METLYKHDASLIILFGLTSDMCVSTSARMASNLGWQVIVVEDACDCFNLPGLTGEIPASLSHDVHMATLAYEFCMVTRTSTVLEALKAFRRTGGTAR